MRRLGLLRLHQATRLGLQGARRQVSVGHLTSQAGEGGGRFLGVVRLPAFCQGPGDVGCFQPRGQGRARIRDLAGRIEADHRIGQAGADLPGEERGRSEAVGFGVQCAGHLAPVGLQLVLREQEVRAVGISQLLANGQTLIVHGLVHKPQQADRRHQRRQQQQQHEP